MKSIPTGSADYQKLNSHLFPKLVDVPMGAQARVRKRIRQSQKTMNKLEAEFCGRLKNVYFTQPYYEPMRIRLCNGSVYIPDFMIVQQSQGATLATMVIFFEVKGNQPIQDDSSVKIKVAAQQYPLFQFRLCWKDNGEWREQIILT